MTRRAPAKRFRALGYTGAPSPIQVLEPHLQLDLVTQRNPVLPDQRNLRLEPAGHFHGIRMQRRQDEPAALVEAQRAKIVVGGDEPEAPATGSPRCALHRPDERRADAGMLAPA